MIVSISGIKNEQEYIDAVNCGVENIGFKVGQCRPGNDFILGSTASRIIKKSLPFCNLFLETELTDINEIADIVSYTGVSTIIVRGHLSPFQLNDLRERLAEYKKIICSFDFSTINIDEMKEILSYIDGFLIDFSTIDGLLNPEELEVQIDACKFFISYAVKPVIISGVTNLLYLQQLAEGLDIFGVILNYGDDLKSVDNRLLIEKLKIMPAVF